MLTTGRRRCAPQLRAVACAPLSLSHPPPPLPPPATTAPVCPSRAQTKADADLEKQMAVLNAKTKLAEEFDRKEKALAMEQRV